MKDSMTMLRRNLLHALRYPSMTISVIAVPVIFLLLFVYVLGGTLDAGLAGPGSYVDYLAPGILIMAAAASAGSTAVAVSVDMTEGIINRFRTMAIGRAAVLAGHVLGSVIVALLSLVAVIGVALLVGFRPTASIGDWVAAIGLLALLVFAITWLSVGGGLMTKGPEAASNVVLPLQLLPLVGSAFVPTDSMPAGLRWFAENQPFTPIIETLRGLLLGTPIGSSGPLAVAWCVVIALLGFLWSRTLFNREPAN
jgi:ABC-2 type transport system permease protein